MGGMLIKGALWVSALVLCSVPVDAQVSFERDSVPPRPVSVEALDFLRPYGIEHFSEHYIEALSTLLTAQRHLGNRDFNAANDVLTSLWSRYPAGDIRWSQLPTSPFGINIGSPPCYYALRMITDIVDWRLGHPDIGDAQRTAILTVVLAGTSSGIEPRNHLELKQGTGVSVVHTLDPLLLRQDSKVIYDSLMLFREYAFAITEGDLDVDVRIVHLPDLGLSVEARVDSGRYIASISDVRQVWESLDEEVINGTDWWWVIYPSHVPEQYSDFENAEFITGGMGSGPDSGSPMFLIDDRWLVRKPPHIGQGRYSKLEREAYLPQWLQHEFYHHLFRIYPEFGLETVPHQWFNRSSWPSDFVGRYEPDYYHEAMYKRLQGADRPLVAALRYATSGRVATLSELGGIYIREPVQNEWHLGSILITPQLEWINAANVSWGLEDDLANRSLLTGPDCPYYGSWEGNRFLVVWKRDELGDELDEVDGFRFVNEFYQRMAP